LFCGDTTLMSFDLFAYAAKYRGRVQVDRVGYIRKQFPSTPEVDVVLQDCAMSFPKPELLVKKYVSSSTTDVLDRGALKSDAFMSAPQEVMWKAFQSGQDATAQSCATQVCDTLDGDSSVSDADRFSRFMSASLVSILTMARPTSTVPTALLHLERMLEQKSTPVLAAAVSSSGNLTGSGSFSDSQSFFCPSPADILRCKLMRALFHLINGKLEDCAITLLNVPQTCLDVEDLSVNDLATISDIVMYISLCSLATMERDRFCTDVIENPDFREWLEREDCATMKRLVESVFNCHWSVAWNTLLEVETSAKYDKFLGKHVPGMMQTIRSKILLQYFKPYQRVKFDTMGKEFGVDPLLLEDAFLRLIESQKLNARIDGINHELVRYLPDNRVNAFESTTESGDKFDMWARRDVFYANIVDGGFLNSDIIKMFLLDHDGVDSAHQMRMMMAARGHGFHGNSKY